jgi:NAD(P)-dependent dehydrogenase (short-subunit alcohol dehydrogenase family)
MEIEGCIALVTGANRGLGKAYTEALLAGGAAKVYAGALNPQQSPIRVSRQSSLTSLPRPMWKLPRKPAQM